MIDIGNIRYQQTSLYLQNSFSIHFITWKRNENEHFVTVLHAFRLYFSDDSA